MVMKIPVDPDTVDWVKVKEITIQSMLVDGDLKSRKEAEGLNWKVMIAQFRREMEQEYIEYTRHRQLLTAITGADNIRPIWKKEGRK